MVHGGERYRRALSRLGALARFGMRPGLEVIGRLLARLGHPEERLPALHIAGTNGKGSTATVAEALLAEAGVRVGLYTSPHLSRLTERVRIARREIEPERCGELVERAFAAADAEGLEATFFEIATAAALLAFAEEGVEVAVLECGLGGRLDATNACHPRASVVTSIGRDHMEVLGDTLEAIAAEKAGIARPGVPLLAGRLLPGPLAVVAARAAAVGAPLLRLGHEVEVAARARPGGRELLLDYRGPGGPLDGAELGLAGLHQADNAALALAAVGLLGVELGPEARRRALASARWPGRLEVVAPDLRLDGAHNGEGAAALARWLAGEPPVTLVVGLLADKEAEAVLAPLLPHARRLVCTRPASPRALPPAELAALARQLRPGLAVDVEEEPAAALSRARDGAAAVVACGSLYLVGALRALVVGEARDPVVVADPLRGGGSGGAAGGKLGG